MATPAENTWLTNLQFVTVETFVIQFIIILIVLWVLNKFVFRPYLAYLDEWEAKQKKVQEDYNNAEAILEEKRKQGDDLLEKARSKGNSVIEEAESMAKSRKDSILLEAQTQAQESLMQAQSQIEKERQSMLSQIKKNMVDITLRLNEKLFKDSKVSKDFIEKNIDSL